MTEQLIERIYAQNGAVIRKLMRRGIDEEDAPDMAVRIILNAVDHLDQLRDPDKLEAWLMISAENAAKSHFKEQKARREKEITTVLNMEAGEEISILDIIPDEKTIENILRIADKEAVVDELLECLDKKQKTILFMHALEEMTFREIAEELEMNDNTVRSIHSRTCIKLQNRWKKLYGKEEYYDR